MLSQNNFNSPSLIKGQQEAYIYNIFNDINKLKILLIFMTKGFTWHRELESFGLYKNLIAETLIEFNNLGLIELKELSELDNVKYETFKTVKYDVQHYFKIYFTTNKIHNLVNEYNEDLNFILNKNPHLLDFIDRVKVKLEPFKIQLSKIMKEETSQFSRKVTLNGVTFEKDTLMSKEVKQILKLTSRKTGTDLILKEIKPLALMTETERKRHINKVTHNGKEISPSIFREIEEKDKEAEEDFKTGTIGKSETELEIEAEKREAGILDLLGIEE